MALSELAARLKSVHRASRAEGGTGTSTIRTLSLRQLLRLAKRAHRYPTGIEESVAGAVMLQFVPPAERNSLVEVLRKYKLAPAEATELTADSEDGITVDVEDSKSSSLRIAVHDGVLTIGATCSPLRMGSNPGLIPQPVFVDIPQHVQLLEQMLRDYVLGEHLLLIGNQGITACCSIINENPSFT